MAPINFNIPRYQRREFVAAPLETYANTLGTLQQRHEQAIQQANATKTFLANKQLNEAENEWLYNYTQDIQNQLESAAESGSYATALTTAQKLAGQVASDPALIGRERYQQQFKEFQEQVKTSKDYDDDVKAYALAMNPYGYQDTTNDKGQITGGTTFNPNYQPVAQVDLNEIYQKALSTVGVDSSQGGQLVWGDENGNLRQGAPNIAGGDLPYLKTSQGIQRLDANKIRQAVEAAIDATPGARASIKQDYTVNAWKASRGDTNNLVTKPDGTIMSIQEFQESMLAPRYKASAYTRVTRDVDPSIGFNFLKAREAQEAAARKKTGTGKQDDFATSFITPIGKQKVEPQTVSQIQADKANYQTSLRNIFADYGIDKTVSDEQGYRLVRNRLLSSGQPTEFVQRKVAELDNIYNQFNIANNRLEGTRAQLTPEQRQATDFLGNKYSNGNMSNAEENRYQREYSEKINKMFFNGDNYENLIINPSDKESFNHILTQLRGRNGLGLSRSDVYTKTIDGKERIIITKEAFAKYGDVMREAISPRSGGLTNRRGASYEMQLYNNDNDIRDLSNNGAKFGGLRVAYNEYGLGEVISKANSASNAADRRIANELAPTYIELFGSNLPIEITAQGMGMTDEQIKSYRNEYKNALANANGGSVGMKIRNENGEFVPVEDSTKREAYMKTLSSRLDDAQISTTVDPITGKLLQVISVPNMLKQGKNTKKFADSDIEDISPASGSLTITIEGIRSQMIDAFERSPQVQNMAKLNAIKYNSALSQGYTLTPEEFGDGTATAGIENGQWFIQTGDNRINVTQEEMTGIITSNKANQVMLNAVQNAADILISQNGSISQAPQDEVEVSVVTPLYIKAFNDFGIDIANVDREQVPVPTLNKIYKHFSDLYYQTTGEYPSARINETGFNK